MIVDDFPTIVAGLASLSLYDSSIEVVGCAVDGLDALAKARELEPDVILMDIKMPKMNGLEATYQLRETHPMIRVLIFTDGAFPNDIAAAMTAGAAGYAKKDDSLDTLVQKIKIVDLGQQIFPAFPDARVKVANAALQKTKQLTKTELLVLQAAAYDSRAKSIASRLSTPEKEMKERNVTTHLANIRAKWGIHNTTEMLLYAIKHGFVEMP